MRKGMITSSEVTQKADYNQTICYKTSKVNVKATVTVGTAILYIILQSVGNVSNVLALYRNKNEIE